ncbi:MAG: TMEM165/GDT1 family protein [Cyanobacteria bacterium]|nr:TMEM165/GDT1 family protein [Cyanobacteria bacterium bin.51]
MSSSPGPDDTPAQQELEGQAGEATPAGAKPADTTVWAIIFTTFTTVFLAELGDKTQLAALLLAAESGRPLLVFAGAAFALICSSLVGVLLGRWLASVLPPQRLERISGLLMVALGLWLGSQASLGLLSP